MDNWISVEEKLPPFDEPIVYCILRRNRANGVGIAYRTVSDKWNPEMESTTTPKGFTHWIPLPPPPETKP